MATGNSLSDRQARLMIENAVDVAADLLFGPLYWRLVVLGHSVDGAQLWTHARATAALKAG